MPKTSKENFSYNKSYDLIILSFPVYSQNIPKPLKDVISKLKSSYFDINITYGKMSFGNCLKDVSRLINWKIIGASLIPSKHTYLNVNSLTESKLVKLDEIVSLIPLRQNINITNFSHHPLSNFLSTLRSQIGVKIKKNTFSNTICTFKSFPKIFCSSSR